jgi:hypothetical protein
MTKALIMVLALLLPGCSHFTAATPEPGARFVEWRTSESLQECQPLRGVVGCAIWEGWVCTIYTRRMTSHEVLGHELRHCFEGHFHN